MRLSDAASAMGGRLFGDDAEFDSVSTDSRNIRAGELFVALKGENFNGEVFVERASLAGACGAVVTKHQKDLNFSQIVVGDGVVALGNLASYKRKALRGRVIAITGSCGKTSVKSMLRCVLERHGSVSFTEGNQNNFIGVPLTILSAANDVDYLIVEAGTSEKGEIAYLSSIINPDVAAVINVHAAHLEGLGTLNGVAEEKSDLYGGGSRLSVAIVNQSLLGYQCFEEKLRDHEMMIFGQEAYESKTIKVDVSARNIDCDTYGRARFDLSCGSNVAHIQLPLLGVHQVENALAAASCAHAVGVPIDVIKVGLESCVGEAKRMHASELKEGFLVDDTYNANPASMRAAIDYLAGQEKGFLVLGDMAELGKDAELEHRQVGQYAAKKGICSLFATGYFAEDYADGFGDSAKLFRNKDELSQYVIEHMDSRTTVLVKGSRSAQMDLVCRAIESSCRGVG